MAIEVALDHDLASEVAARHLSEEKAIMVQLLRNQESHTGPKKNDDEHDCLSIVPRGIPRS